MSCFCECLVSTNQLFSSFYFFNFIPFFFFLNVQTCSLSLPTGSWKATHHAQPSLVKLPAPPSPGRQKGAFSVVCLFWFFPPLSSFNFFLITCATCPLHLTADTTKRDAGGGDRIHYFGSNRSEMLRNQRVCSRASWLVRCFFIKIAAAVVNSSFLLGRIYLARMLINLFLKPFLVNGNREKNTNGRPL